MTGRSIPFFFLLLLLLGDGAANRSCAAELEARVDRTEVSIDGRVTLTLTIEGPKGGEAEIDLGVTGGFQVHSAGTSQSISIVNGSMTSSITHTYLLTPRREGDQKLGPFRVTIGDETATATAIQIHVTPGSPTPGPNTAPTGRSGGRSAPGKDVFIRTFIDKDEVYVREQVTLTFRLYTRIRLGRDPEYSPPSTEGFWKEDLPPQQRFYDEINGQRYLVNEIKTALFPTGPGRLVIGPARLAYEEDTFFSTDPFDLLRGGMRSRRRPVRETLRSDSLAVDVKPLPAAGKPRGFDGAVGSFTLSASLDKSEVNANEPVTMTVTLAGEGNVQTAVIPDPDIPETFKVYDSGSSTETSKEGYRLRGKKTYTRVFVPRYGGDYTVGPISFSYFDPRQAAYVTRQAGPFQIAVNGAPPESGIARQQIEMKEEDIRYIKEPGPLRWEHADAGFPVTALAAGNGLPLILIGLLFLGRRRRERFEKDRVWARARRAGGAARKALAEARREIGGEGNREFAAALSRGVTGYIGDKANIAASGMTRKELETNLQQRKAGEERIERLSRFLTDCDRVRYSDRPVPRDERERLLREGEELIGDLRRFLSKGGGR